MKEALMKGTNFSYNMMRISMSVQGGGTTEYASPELALNGDVTAFSDVWSMGIILYKIVYKKHPLQPRSYMCSKSSAKEK